MKSIEEKNVKGILLREVEVASWDNEWFSEFFIFCEFFYNENGKIVVNNDTVTAAYQYRDSSWFLDEMLERIDRPVEDNVKWKPKFYMRLNVLMRTVINGIKKKPEILSPVLVEKYRGKFQNDWMNKIYDGSGKPKTTVVEITPTAEKEIIPSQGDILPSQRLQEAMGKVADIYDMIAGTITMKDIKGMNVKDKINALNKLSYIHNTTKKFKPSMNFIKINTKTGSKEELEQALLTFDDEE